MVFVFTDFSIVHQKKKTKKRIKKAHSLIKRRLIRISFDDTVAKIKYNEKRKSPSSNKSMISSSGAMNTQRHTEQELVIP